MNKLIKVFDLLKIINDHEREILSSIKIVKTSNVNNEYFFDINLLVPLPTSLYYKINFVSFNGIVVYTKINNVVNISHNDIKMYLLDFFKSQANIKFLNKEAAYKKVNYDEKKITFYYYSESELDELNQNKEKISTILKNALGMKDVLIEMVFDEEFANKVNKKQALKNELLKDKIKKINNQKEANQMVQEIRIDGKVTPFKKVVEGLTNINVTGEIFDIEKNKTSKANVYKFYITDYEDTFIIKCILSTEHKNTKKYINENLLENFKNGDWILATVDVKLDQYEMEKYGMINKIKEVERPNKFNRFDDASNKRVELMVHTKMSSFDSINEVEDVFKLAKNFKMNSIGFCDRYNIQSYPEIQKCANKYNIKPIYGVELEVLPNICKNVINETSEKIENKIHIVFDLETTGLYPEFDDIIEFGAIKTNGVEILDRVQFFIKPNKEVSANVSTLTGITNKMLENAIDQASGIKRIIDYIGNYPIIAHNAISFDFLFLNKKAEKYLGINLTNTVIDTLYISRSLWPAWKNHRLQKMCSELGIEYTQDDAHRADYDAYVLFLCWVKIIEKLKENKINNLNEINSLSSNSLLAKYNSHILVIYNKNESSLRLTNEIISKSYTDNYFNRPTVNKNEIDHKKSELIIASHPIEGEIFNLAINGTEKDLINAINFYDYIFICPPCDLVHLYKNQEITLKNIEMVTKKIIELAKKQNKKIIAVSNSYYLKPWDKKFQYVYLYAKGIGGHRHRFFKYNELPNSYVKTTEEMLESFKFLEDENLIKEIVIDNTIYFEKEISNNIRPIKDKLYTPKIDNVNELLKNKVYENAYLNYGNKLPEIVSARIKKELDSIINNDFSAIYWISHLLVAKSLNDGYVVGSRGSVGSSLVATMLKITDVNPLQPHYVCKKCHYFELVNDIDDGYDLEPKKCPNCNNLITGDGHNIPFETFLGFKCDKVPDIDLNFSGVYQAKAHNFIREMFGNNHAFRAGTISTIATKTCFGYVKAYFDEIHDFNVSRSMLNLYVKKCQDVKRTTGQHPGGILIVPKEYSVFDFCPYNFPADVKGDWYTTHYAFEYLHDNLLKFDILGHDNPTILKKLKELTNVDEKDVPNFDKNVIKLFTSNKPLNLKENIQEETGAISIPEFGTKFVRKMLLDTKPSSFSDLIRISGLSHGTDVYNGNAKTLITDDNLKLKNVIACRDDILIYLINLGIENSIAFKIMEDVRKGKGLKDEYVEIMLNHNVPKWYIESCNKIKYIFPKAHATAYVMHAWKFAWYKIYYPLEYYASYLSIKLDAFDIETIVKGKKAILEKFNDISNRLNDKEQAKNVKKKEEYLLSVFEIILEMEARGFSIEKPNILISLANDFIIKDNKLIAPFSVVDGVGLEVAQSIIDARDERPFTSLDDVIKRTKLNKTNIQLLESIGVFDSLPKNDQIKLFDF